MNTKQLLGFGVLVGVLGGGLPERAEAAVTWNVTFLDVTGSTGNGFDDATDGANRQTTVLAVTNYISTVLDHTGTIDLEIGVSQTDGSGFLASGGTSFFTSTPGFYNGFAFDRVTTGVDPNPGSREAFATFDFGYTWNSELDAPTGSEYDLFTVTLHELCHSLGLLTLTDVNGNSVFAGSGVHSVMDSFLQLGVNPATTNLFDAGANYVGNPGDLNSDNVFFDGPNAVLANGGTNAAKIYAPLTFQPGSSLSHVDTATYPNAVMTHAVATGVQKRAWTSIDLAILEDIGWSLTTPIPEPGRAVVALFGFAVVLLRRRR